MKELTFIPFKCRKFKGSDKVKQMAIECFHKFHYMFAIMPGDTFNSIFEKEREKFLSENVEELKKERALATKLFDNSQNHIMKRKLSKNIEAKKSKIAKID